MGAVMHFSDPAEEEAEMSAVVQLMERYQNGYRAAGTACRLGTTAKVIGVIAGAFVWLGGLQNSLGAVAASLGFLAIALFWIIGALVSAVGENLRASLDTAVYTSTFLDNVQRAKIMSLK
jgi:small basic protein